MEGLRIRRPNESNDMNAHIRNQYGNVYKNVHGNNVNSGTNYNNTAYEVNTTELNRVINLHNRIATAAARNPNLSPYNRAKIVNRLRKHVNLPLKKNLLNIYNSNNNTNTNTVKLNAITTVSNTNGNELSRIERINSLYNTPNVRRRKTRKTRRSSRTTRRSRRS
jgi:hypothetical protein